ncbi:60S ribosomal protein L6 [Atractiella rhizophila]|nr:60S ribosomal protein L6 [Atractiella rhizophila]
MARNSTISAHIGRHSSSKLRSKTGLYKRKPASTTASKTATEATKTKTIGGKANGGSRAIPTTRGPKYYPAEDVKTPKKSRKSTSVAKLRSTITPGQVLILLAGKYAGKRVVFLKQLSSGLLLVTGPFKLNGVPLRRVDQSYVIATSTKVDVAGVKLDEKLDDKFFSRTVSKSRKGTEGEFFEGKKQKVPASEEKIASQKEVDNSVLSALKSTPNLAKYLSTQFSLSRTQHPHLLKF